MLHLIWPRRSATTTTTPATPITPKRTGSIQIRGNTVLRL
jgi:hypothetical protein